LKFLRLQKSLQNIFYERLRKKLDTNYYFTKFNTAKISSIGIDFANYIEFICVRNQLLDVITVYKNARENPENPGILTESELTDFINACSKIITNHDMAFSAIKAVTDDPADILRLIEQNFIQEFTFAKLRKLNRDNPTAFIALLQYGFFSGVEVNDAKEHAEVVPKILAIDALFEPKNKNNLCIAEVLYIVTSSISSKSHECRELKAKLNEVLEKYKDNNKDNDFLLN